MQACTRPVRAPRASVLVKAALVLVREAFLKMAIFCKTYKSKSGLRTKWKGEKFIGIFLPVLAQAVTRLFFSEHDFQSVRDA
jgi:hypothetical protein